MVFKEKGIPVGNTFLESLTEKFDRSVSNFVLGNAESLRDYPIVYCSDGFCELTGYNRYEVMGNSCHCDFLYSLQTDYSTVDRIKDALRQEKELTAEIDLAKKDGSHFRCVLDTVPIRNESGDVVLFLVSHKEVQHKPHQSIKSEVSLKPTPPSGVTKTRKFSRDVLFHLQKRYQGNSQSPTSQVGNPESQLIPEYKLENTVLPSLMLLHFGRLRLIWDWIILLLVAYLSILLPFNVAFKEHHNLKPFFIADFCLEFIFITDIILNFRTTYINAKTGRLVTNPKQIAFNYLKHWFVLDMIAVLPFDVIYFCHNDWAYIVAVLKLTRLLRLFRIGRRVSRSIEYTGTLLVLMMFSFTLLSHWLACIWYVIGFEELHAGQTTGWLMKLGDQVQKPYRNQTRGGPSYSEEYISALYFIFTSLTTVGFGNISPNTVAEKVFSVIVLILGAIVQSAIFGNMTAIIQKLYASRARFHAKASQIKQFVQHHQIDGDLQKRIESWFVSYWSVSNGVNTEEMLESFPSELQADICLHLYRRFLTLPCFSHASRGCLRSISSKVRKANFSPGELIIKEKDAINTLFFMERGTVEIVQREFIVAILGSGDVFGEDICKSSQSNHRSNGDVKALMHCEVLFLSRDSMRDVVRFYSDFGETFSRLLQLSFDLSHVKMQKPSIGLGSIVEEDEGQSAISMTSSSDEESYHDVTNKPRNTKKKNSLPLWQLRSIQNELNNSPSPSLKFRLMKLESSSTCSENSEIVCKLKKSPEAEQSFDDTAVDTKDEEVQTDTISIDSTSVIKNFDIVEPSPATKRRLIRANNGSGFRRSRYAASYFANHCPEEDSQDSSTREREIPQIIENMHTQQTIAQPKENRVKSTPRLRKRNNNSKNHFLQKEGIPQQSNYVTKTTTLNNGYPSIVIDTEYDGNNNPNDSKNRPDVSPIRNTNLLDSFNHDQDQGIYSLCSDSSVYNERPVAMTSSVHDEHLTEWLDHVTRFTKATLSKDTTLNSSQDSVIDPEHFHQMRGELGTLRNEISEIKSGMMALTELVRISVAGKPTSENSETGV
eukprot:TCONS_00054981-protein